MRLSGLPHMLGSGRVISDFFPFAFSFTVQVGRVCQCPCQWREVEGAAAIVMSVSIHIEEWQRALSGNHSIVVLPRRNALHARSGVPTVTTDDSSNNLTASSSSDPTSQSVPMPSVQPRLTMRGPHVALITSAVVGGVVVVAIILALVYYRRIRQRVKRMKRCTNILGPGASRPLAVPEVGPLASYHEGAVSSRRTLLTVSRWVLELVPMPMSPSRVSQHTVEIGSNARRDGVQFEIVSPLMSTFNPIKNSQHPLGGPLLSPPGHPPSPLRTSTILVDPPSTRRTSIFTPDPRSSIRVPPETMLRPNRRSPLSPLRTSSITVDSPSARRTSILSPTPRNPVRSSPEMMSQSTGKVPLSLHPSTVIIGPPPALRKTILSPSPQGPIRSSPEPMSRPTREVPSSLSPSTIVVDSPPALRTSIMFSEEPRSPIRPPPDTMKLPNPWPHPRYDNEEHSTSSDSESSHTLN